MSKNVKWTKEQLQAINEKGNNILVAAAAGSGKTAVLVERIIHKIIDEKIDINKMLVVTFTNAAASEMRERTLEAIYGALEKEPQNLHLQRQIMLLNKASISTIHSFCLDVIHNNFYELDLPSNFRIADETEINLIKQEAMDELFEEKYIEEDADFVDLLERYSSYKNDESLQELIFKISRYIESTPYPEKWLNDKVSLFCIKEDEQIENNIFVKYVISEIKEKLNDSLLILNKAKQRVKMYQELEKATLLLSKEIVDIEDAILKIHSWDKLFLAINNIEFARWPSIRKCTIEENTIAKDIRNEAKTIIEKQIKPIIRMNEEEIKDSFKKMKEILNKISKLVIEYTTKFQNKKRERNCVDFGDIEHFALKILVNEDGSKTQIAKKYEDQFEEIAIDEYQDSNLVQEAILKSVSRGNNIFMVGDVKQSIYKFRQSRPELFLEKYENYLEKEKLQERKTENKEENKENLGLKIQLFRNFRSRENVLDITNLIFESIMSKELGDIKYDENEYLNYGANYPEVLKEKNEKNINRKTEIDIIDVKEDDSVTAFKNDAVNSEKEDEENQEPIEDTIVEAKFVANRVKELLDEGYVVFDKKTKEYRKILKKDIAILLRAPNNLAPIYEKELADLDISSFSDVSNEYLDSTEISTILSVLKIIDNPTQEIPLVIVLRSMIGNFTDNDLIDIRLNDRNCNFYEALLKARISSTGKLKEKIEIFIEKLEKWKSESEYLPLEELIWQIYIDTNYYEYVGLLPNGKMRQENLKSLFEKAKEYASASYKGLFNFIQFIEKLKKNAGDFSSSKLIGENEDVVHIMSIHKSKGLEFPVVFLSKTHKKFNFMDLRESILLHQDLGFGMEVIDKDKRIRYDTIAKDAIKIKAEQEIKSEEERILYVALTRAKEKLIITGKSDDIQKELQKKEEQISIRPIEKDELKIDSSLVKKCNSYLDWIEYVYLYNKNREFSLKGKKMKIDDVLEFNTYKKTEILKHIQKEVVEEKENRKENINIEANKNKDYSKIEEKLNWKYGYDVDTLLPTKTSVSKLKKEGTSELISIYEDKLLNTEENEEIEQEREREQQEDKYNNLLEIVPKFVDNKEVITSAKKGTLVHLCIQKIDEKKDYEKKDIIDLIESLVEKQIITKEEAEEIPVEYIVNYTNSKLYKELKDAIEIHKEQPFYISIPTKEIYKEAKEQNSNKKVLVQGVIDLYYINKDNELKLVDFKTDYIPKGKEQEIRDKYKIQLQIYKQALEKALNKKVVSSEVYLLRKNNND